MLEFISQITDKPRWTEKIYDETILAKWRSEALGTEHDQQFSNRHMTGKCFDYVRVPCFPKSFADVVSD